MNTMTTFTYLLNLEKSLDPFMENKIKKYEEKSKRALAKSDIDPEILKEGLHELGITFDKFNHAYLGMNISEKELISIGGINKFIYLQNVNVSNNMLTSLEQLSGLQHLTKLNASKNKIIEIFDFEAPQNLEYADYSHNQIKFIENIYKNKFLKTLMLNHNKISKIENLGENQFLEILDLSYNEIEIIENLDNLEPCLQKLNLMNNKIRAISGLDHLTSLLELNLSKNLISRLKGLQGLSNLRYLYLSSNSLSRAKQVAYISELTFLTDVDFCYNEVQNRKFYRFQILFYLPQLRRLDGQEVTHFEKVKADILFGADLETKKEIFKGFLLDEQFVDRRLFVAEQIDPESDSEEENFENRDKKVKTNNNLINSKNMTLSSIYGKKTKDGHLYGDTELANLEEMKMASLTN